MLLSIIFANRSMGPKQILPPRVRVNLGVKAMKGYSIFPRPSELEPHHHHIQNTSKVNMPLNKRNQTKPRQFFFFWGGETVDTVSVF